MWKKLKHYLLFHKIRTIEKRFSNANGGFVIRRYYCDKCKDLYDDEESDKYKTPENAYLLKCFDEEK